MTLRSTKEDWIGDCQENLRQLSGEGDQFRPLSSLYSLSKPDAIRLERYLNEAIYNDRKLRETIAKLEDQLKAPGKPTMVEGGKR
jgi:hypothetical protein